MLLSCILFVPRVDVNREGGGGGGGEDSNFYRRIDVKRGTMSLDDSPNYDAP